MESKLTNKQTVKNVNIPEMVVTMRTILLKTRLESLNPRPGCNLLRFWAKNSNRNPWRWYQCCVWLVRDYDWDQDHCWCWSWNRVLGSVPFGSSEEWKIFFLIFEKMYVHLCEYKFYLLWADIGLIKKFSICVLPM